jgi:hypothetical protein
MNQRWSPLVAALVTCGVIVVVLVGGTAAVAEAGLVPHPGAFGEKIGRVLLPLLLVGGLVAYYVQRSRRS